MGWCRETSTYFGACVCALVCGDVANSVGCVHCVLAGARNYLYAPCVAFDVHAEWSTRTPESDHPMTLFLLPSPSRRLTHISLAPSHATHPRTLSPPRAPRSLSHQVMSFLIKRGGVNVSRILLTHGAEELMVKGQKRSTVFSDAILIKAHNALGVALTAFEPDVNVSAACGTHSVCVLCFCVLRALCALCAVCGVRFKSVLCVRCAVCHVAAPL